MPSVSRRSAAASCSALHNRSSASAISREGLECVGAFVDAVTDDLELLQFRREQTAPGLLAFVTAETRDEM